MNANASPILNDRLPHLDGLRGLAILLVLMTHAWVYSGAPALSFSVGGHTVLLASIPAIGHVGVNLFLVLSGFCLAWPFASDRTYRDRMTLGRFWSRRVRRIVPAYYVSMLLIVGLTVAFDALARRALSPDAAGRMNFGTLPSTGDVWRHLLFVHNVSVEHASTINGSYWSLALEFQLYMMFPLLLEAMFRWGPWRVLGVILALQFAYRLSLEAVLPANVLTEFEFVLPKAMVGRMLDFVCGMAAAHLVAGELRAHARIRGARWIMAGAVACLLAGFSLNYGRWAPYSVIDALWALGFAGLICGVSGGKGIGYRAFCFRPLMALGVCSYSVYLLHAPLMERAGFLTGLYFRPGKAFFVGLALLPVVVAICAGFFRICERPAMDYFARKRPAKPARPRSLTVSTGEPLVLEQAVG